MGDYVCRECSDRGDCRMCSPVFERERVHQCGLRWGDHVRDERGWAQCPAQHTADHKGAAGPRPYEEAMTELQDLQTRSESGKPPWLIRFIFRVATRWYSCEHGYHRVAKGRYTGTGWFVGTCDDCGELII